MKLTFALVPVLAFSTAMAAAGKDAVKPKPCPKGQVATTEKATGKQACFAMQMTMEPGQPAPMDSKPPKPVPKPN